MLVFWTPFWTSLSLRGVVLAKHLFSIIEGGGWYFRVVLKNCVKTTHRVVKKQLKKSGQQLAFYLMFFKTPEPQSQALEPFSCSDKIAGSAALPESQLFVIRKKWIIFVWCIIIVNFNKNRFLGDSKMYFNQCVLILNRYKLTSWWLCSIAATGTVWNLDNNEFSFNFSYPQMLFLRGVFGRGKQKIL